MRNPKQDYPETEEYLEVKGWGEAWNDYQRKKRIFLKHKQFFADRLLSELSAEDDR